MTTLQDSYGTEIPYPRVDIATAMLSTTSDGLVSVSSDRSFCDDALNSNDCFY